MISKPNDWDTAQAFTGETMEQIKPGGHIVRILAMRQDVSKNTKKPMLIVAFDIEEGLEFDGYYKRLHDTKKKFNAAAAWPGVIRFMLYNKEGGTNGFFKGFIAAVEESNPGYAWNWDERSIAGKKVGMVFREEEYRAQDGSIKSSVKAFQVRSIKAIEEGVPVPEKKALLEAPQTFAPFDPTAGFTQVEDDFPF